MAVQLRRNTHLAHFCTELCVGCPIDGRDVQRRSYHFVVLLLSIEPLWVSSGKGNPNPLTQGLGNGLGDGSDWIGIIAVLMWVKKPWVSREELIPVFPLLLIGLTDASASMFIPIGHLSGGCLNGLTWLSQECSGEGL